MEVAQDTFISSTFWTERIGFTAALATIKKMEEQNVPEKLIHYGELINKGWSELAQKHGLEIHISGIPPLTHITFKAENPLAIQTLYTQEMLKKGYLLGAAIYTSFSYTVDVINQFLEESDSVFKKIKDSLNNNNIQSQLKGDIIHSGFKRLT